MSEELTDLAAEYYKAQELINKLKKRNKKLKELVEKLGNRSKVVKKCSCYRVHESVDKGTNEWRTFSSG